MKKTIGFWLIGLLALLIFGGCSQISNKPMHVQYPVKAIQMIVPYASGGGTDEVGRILANALQNVLKQEVVVVNKTGGSGAVGMNEGLHAPSDGYTITMVTREVAMLPAFGQAPFKTMDFKFISNINSDPEVIAVSSDSSFKTIEDLIVAMKLNPGKIRYAASSWPNVYGVQFAMAADVNFITVPFQGAVPSIAEVLSGRADFGIYNPAEVKRQVESGKLRTLAVMAEKRFAAFGDTPTLQEKGLEVVCYTYRGIAVPPNTPDEVTKILEDALAQAVKDPKFVEYMNKSMYSVDYKPSADFKKQIETDVKFLTPMVQATSKK